MSDLETFIKTKASEVGFDIARIAQIPDSWDAATFLKDFVQSGFHGEMQWMEETLERRQHPQSMWPEAKSAVILGLNYGPEHNPLDDLKNGTNATISVYARNSDYHDLIKKRLKRIARAMVEQANLDVKVFVDTAPLMEKPLAQASGLGWQGKHTNVVNRELGSWLFLGVILTDRKLEPDAPEIDHCGSCRSCLDICPTDAFPAPYKLDARKCISYLTIEHKAPIPHALRSKMGNRIYGCDDCLAICPWNKFAKTAREAAFHPRPELTHTSLVDLSTLNDANFRTLFAGSPIKRIGRDRFVRNVMIAIGNSNAPALTEACMKRLDDTSPLVRGAAIWALGELSPQLFNSERDRRRTSEPDPNVREEWDVGPIT